MILYSIGSFFPFISQPKKLIFKHLKFRKQSSSLVLLSLSFLSYSCLAGEVPKEIDFNRDIRQLLSNNCFFCHGPDEEERKGGLRLDTREGATAEHKGRRAVVPGKPEESELLIRMQTHDEDDIMPPEESGKKITPQQIALIKEWIVQGAPYAKHWAYVKPERPEIPKTKQSEWANNPIDQFVLARLEKEGLKPSPSLDRLTLARRLSLDLIGLPPSNSEVDDFLSDKSHHAIEKFVDKLLSKETFGEHWSRMWLDLARYADSAGYADDGKRTIWAYRDYVIKSFNENKPFDVFTREQLAGDLLENASEEQLVATAFHRNTQTNSEGGTIDEEFRNAAVVDRVNTTMAVWMGTTMGCAQCHTHKFDPITHSEYFQFFSVFNNTEDNDQKNESPTLEIWTKEQEQSKKNLAGSVVGLEKILSTETEATKKSQAKWETTISKDINWTSCGSQVSSREATPNKTTLNYKVKGDRLTALKLEVPKNVSLAKGSTIHKVQAFLVPNEVKVKKDVRYVRIEIPGEKKILSLAEVEVYHKGENIAPKGIAKQKSSVHSGIASRAIDKKTSGLYGENSVTHTETQKDPWWELDLKDKQDISKIVIWNREDGVGDRLKGAKVQLLDQARNEIWSTVIKNPAKRDQTLNFSAPVKIPIKVAKATNLKGQKDVSIVLQANKRKQGWKLPGYTKYTEELILTPRTSVDLKGSGFVKIILEHTPVKESDFKQNLNVYYSHQSHTIDFVNLPASISATVLKLKKDRTKKAQVELDQHYLAHIAPELAKPRKELHALKAKLNSIKPYTTVPVFKERSSDKLRKTYIQIRGNYRVPGEEVQPGITASLHPYKQKAPMTRLTLANWLMDKDNPLTARVTVNRYWEKLFGLGIVSSSDEFGSQGELPSHPKLLDWLAIELIEKKWDIKYLIKLIVMSATYQQTSTVDPQLTELDPINTLLTRGPRVRLSAEMIRDQALFISGLLSNKLYGPPVQPPQPSMGVKAAFGSGIDWVTSKGEDRYRRGIYTEWRRSNPYPSMAAFDAPNREVCIIKRDSSNTPLQALVTLNDPVYVEAAQALARRSVKAGQSNDENLKSCFKFCVSREPSERELESLNHLYQDALKTYRKDLSQATSMATIPLGDLPKGSDVAQMAAMTVVSNVLLNLDEILLKR